MSYSNVFTGGGGQAETAEQVAGQLHDQIPGAWPEQQGVDPELYDDIPDQPCDPKIVNELSLGALNIAGNFLVPLFQKFQTLAVDQLAVSENPASTASTASSTEDEVSKGMNADISDKDKPTAATPTARTAVAPPAAAPAPPGT